MAEIPERRVLKGILAKLKTKTISEEKHFQNQTKSTLDFFTKSHQQALQWKKEHRNNISVDSHLNIVYTLVEQVGDLIHASIDVLEDMKLYIDSLEKYSAELDKTLSDIFEQAKKQAEEQIKEQAEQMKKGSTEYIK
jgi:hypothetical protein